MDLPRMKFKLGRLVITPGALTALTDSGDTVWHLVVRHMGGDWGEVDEEDWQLNNQALVDSSRILSAYSLKSGVRIWIITEADRSSTTILLPDEY